MIPVLKALKTAAALLLCSTPSASPEAGSPSAMPESPTRLAVPIVRQAPERCGPAALAMVLGYYRADAAALQQVERAYDPVLHGALITELAGAARRAGYEAAVATLAPDSLTGLLAAGVPPIVLFQTGTGPITIAHYGVVTGWDPDREVFTLHDGGARPRVMRRRELARRWKTAGSQALIVRNRAP